MKDRKSEKQILNDALCDVSKIPDTLIWRNNTGMGWQGERLRLFPGAYIEIEPNMVVLRNARPVHFGLEGSGDFIGATQGIPLAVETKTLSGKQRVAQGNFERAWTKAGGLYVLARSPEEALLSIFSALGDKSI